MTERDLPSEDAKKVSDQGWAAPLAGLKEILELGGTLHPDHYRLEVP